MLVLAICCLSLFIFGVDSTIVNVALPSIQRSLHAGPTSIEWVVSGYMLAFAAGGLSTGDVYAACDRIGAA
jgi:MFS family permease